MLTDLNHTRTSDPKEYLDSEDALTELAIISRCLSHQMMSPSELDPKQGMSVLTVAELDLTKLTNLSLF